MDEIKKVKLRTGTQTRLSRLWYAFNKRVKGVKPIYNVNYVGDGKNEHTLDVMRVEGEGLPCVIYCHGGGWSCYDKSVFRSTTKVLASYKAVVFNCNVRLAPEHNFADMEEDVASVFAFVKANAKKYGGNPERIVFAGDSSGAQLLTLYLNRQICLDNEDIKRVKGCVCFYGVYDLSTLDEVGFNNHDGYIKAALPLDMPNRNKYLKEYSPLTYISPQIPPMLFCCGMVDPLTKGQTLMYIQRLEELGVQTRSLIFPETETRAAHRFITFVNNPCAKRSFEAFGKFLSGLGA